jgi:hypothetical protein
VSRGLSSPYTVLLSECRRLFDYIIVFGVNEKMKKVVGKDHQVGRSHRHNSVKPGMIQSWLSFMCLILSWRT